MGQGFTIIHAANECLSTYGRQAGSGTAQIEEQDVQKMFPVAWIDFEYTTHTATATAKTG